MTKSIRVTRKLAHKKHIPIHGSTKREVCTSLRRYRKIRPKVNSLKTASPGLGLADLRKYVDKYNLGVKARTAVELRRKIKSLY